MVKIMKQDEVDEVIKPLSVAYDEFKRNLTILINESMLPPFVIENVLKDFYSTLCTLSKKQLESDTIKYQEELVKQQKNNQENV